MHGGMALSNPYKLPREVLSLVPLQQSTKEGMEHFLSSSFALLLLVSFFGVVLTEEAQKKDLSRSMSTTIIHPSTSATTSPAAVLDTTAPTKPAITIRSRDRQSQSGSGGRAVEYKGKKDNNSGDDRPGKKTV